MPPGDLPTLSRPPISPPGVQPPAGGPVQAAVLSATIGYVDAGRRRRRRRRCVEPLVELLDRDLAEARELVEQHVAAVHQVVRRVAVGDERRRSSCSGRRARSRSWRPRRPGRRSRRTGPARVCCAATICERTDVDRVGQRARPAARAPAWRPRRPGPWRGPTRTFQNFASCALMPLSPGSASESSAVSSASACAVHSLRFVFWPRYCESRNWSRTRRKPWTSTPEPRWAPVADEEPATWTCSAWRGRQRGLLARVALGRGVGDVVAGRVEHPLLGHQGRAATSACRRRRRRALGRVRPGGPGRGRRAGQWGRTLRGATGAGCSPARALGRSGG